MIGSFINLVPRALSYLPYGAREREREPGKRWSRGSRTSELPENLESKTSVVAGLTDDTNLRS